MRNPFVHEDDATAASFSGSELTAVGHLSKLRHVSRAEKGSFVDKAAIAKPKIIAERLLQAKENACHSLAVSDIYDLDDGEESLFEEALVGHVNPVAEKASGYDPAPAHCVSGVGASSARH
jgi:hypothetical protein